MKKILAFALSAVMALALLAGCGNQTDNNSSNNDNGGDASDTPAASVSGTVSTDGSTSMEKVIGALSESYMAANKDVTVNYNPTRLRRRHTAVPEGTVTSAFPPAPEGRGEGGRRRKPCWPTMASPSSSTLTTPSAT